MLLGSAHPVHSPSLRHRRTHHRTPPNSRYATPKTTPSTGVARGATTPLGDRLTERQVAETAHAEAEIHRYQYDRDGLLIVLAVSSVFVLGKNVELIATTSVPVGADPTINPATTRTIAVLEAGTRRDVLSCKDLKHYFVPEVRLPDGRSGFVIGGQFDLRKKTPSLLFDKPIVFSCP